MASVDVIRLHLQDVDWSEIEKSIAEHRSYSKQVLSFEPGQMGVALNGRLIGPFEEDEEFIAADFLLLEKHALKLSVNKIHSAILPKLS